MLYPSIAILFPDKFSKDVFLGYSSTKRRTIWSYSLYGCTPSCWNAFKTLPSLEISLIKKLKKNNKKLFLLSCGVDKKSVEYALNEKFRY